MSKDKYAEFRKFGKQGGKLKGINHKITRRNLLDELSKLVDKEFLNWIQAKWNNEDIRKLLKAWQKD